MGLMLHVNTRTCFLEQHSHETSSLATSLGTRHPKLYMRGNGAVYLLMRVISVCVELCFKNVVINT